MDTVALERLKKLTQEAVDKCKERIEAKEHSDNEMTSRMKRRHGL